MRASNPSTQNRTTWTTTILWCRQEQNNGYIFQMCLCDRAREMPMQKNTRAEFNDNKQRALCGFDRYFCILRTQTTRCYVLLWLSLSSSVLCMSSFVWLLWHLSSLGQLNLEPTRPNGFIGCNVPTDLVKISLCQRSHAHRFLLYYICPLASLDIEIDNKAKTPYNDGDNEESLEWHSCRVEFLVSIGGIASCQSESLQSLYGK